MTNPGIVTTREIVDLIKQSGVHDGEFRFFTNEDEFMQVAANTPRSNCVMSSEKLLQTGIQLTEVHEAIERDLRNWTKIGPAHTSERPDHQANFGMGSLHGRGNREMAGFASREADIPLAHA